jgi:hypothetical protein
MKKYTAKVLKFGLREQNVEQLIQDHVCDMSNSGYELNSHSSCTTPLYIIHTFLWTKPMNDSEARAKGLK